MKKILIATHSHFASGIKSTVELLSGSKDNISTIDAFVDDINLINEIQNFINSVNDSDQAIIFTDIKFGSVNQSVMNLISPMSNNIFVITGFNLPLLLELCLTDEEFTIERIREIVQQAKEEMILMNDMTIENNAEDDFFN